MFISEGEGAFFDFFAFFWEHCTTPGDPPAHQQHTCMMKTSGRSFDAVGDDGIDTTWEGWHCRRWRNTQGNQIATGVF